MSQKGTTKIEKGHDYSKSACSCKQGARETKRRGEERALFQELLLNYNPLAPSGGQEKNNMSVKEITASFFTLKYVGIKIKEKNKGKKTKFLWLYDTSHIL